MKDYPTFSGLGKEKNSEGRSVVMDNNKANKLANAMTDSLVVGIQGLGFTVDNKEKRDLRHAIVAIVVRNSDKMDHAMEIVMGGENAA